MAEAQAKLQSLSEEYQKIQQELQDAIQSRQTLEAQKSENEGVKQEFEGLKEGESIYKLVGPALLKQEKVEAESTVNGRLEFIGKELSRTEDSIKDFQNKLDKKKGEIIQVQASAQQAGGGQPQAPS